MSLHFPIVDWYRASNIYEINIRQYTPEGTFKAFQKHLPRLKDMGIEILWFMPITPISVTNRKGTLGSYYACSSYTQINPEFGNMDDFKDLVQNAHDLGFKVIIDWVANHTGVDHEWTETHPDYYLKDAQGNFVEINGWDDAIDLNYENPAMRKALIDAMIFWVKNVDIDGFRCDMAHLVPLDFWVEAREECDQVKKLFWLAECDSDNYLEVFDVNYAWGWMHATNDLAQNPTIGLHGIYPFLQADLIKLPNAFKLWFTSNHDENSWNGTEYDKYGKYALTWAVFSCLFPGMPLIYSGQEIPNQKKLAFFEKDTLEWLTNNLPALHTFYQTLLHFRKSNICFDTDATCTLISNEYSDRILAFILSKNGQAVIALFNFSNENIANYEISSEHLNKPFVSLFSGMEYVFQAKEQFALMPSEYLVYYSK
ncbi:alpha-amylase family glycosyl hydrolase [Rhizosphaericola mali]|uniref:1,4-alpha-glucan branching protein n=1 Tax=Rhizosphaericola mali TaxID=2545455 RepID=A0A5P2FZV6_9BACT|nr:alpha-amylase family glycosyl hydrolase [Rhizosphaericola mali]QES87399.1 1,4-alpha-glucan branching protein [Rhizosphaericola mali]